MNYEELKAKNDLISQHLGWRYEKAPGTEKIFVWKDPEEPAKIILRNEFDRNLGLLIEALEKISKKESFQFNIHFNEKSECIFEEDGEIIEIERAETVHLSAFNCLTKFLEKNVKIKI